jgi:hypothetical protein
VLFSTGLVLTAHYCGGNLADLQLFQEASCCCDDDETGAPDDCCKDEIKTLKITDAQIKSEHETFSFSCFGQDGDLSKFYSPITFVDCSQVISVRATDLPPPPHLDAQVPDYIKFHRLIFYS